MMQIWDEEESHHSGDDRPEDEPSGSRSAPSRPPGLEVVPVPESASELAVAPLPAPLELQKTRKLPDESAVVVHEIKVKVAHRLSNGSEYTIQAGPRLKALQETFGNPHNKVVVFARLSKKPSGRSTPEPTVSRINAPLVLELFLSKEDSTWQIIPWKKWEFVKYAKKPAWTMLLYGREGTDADKAASLEASPWHELASAVEDVQVPLTHLPTVMKNLIYGTSEDKEKTIMSLHRKLYHKPGAELRILMQRAGVPLHVLATVEEIVKTCQVCS